MNIITSKFFAYLYLFFMLIGPVVAIGFWVIDKNFMYLPKVIYYPTFLIIILGLFCGRRIKIDWFTIYILAYAVFLVIYGVTTNELGKASFAHIFTLMLPLLGFSFGYILVSSKFDFFSYFESKIITFGVVLSLLIMLYYILHMAGLIPYFGASTGIFLPILFCFHKKKYFFLLLFIVAALFTGKRGVIIGVFLVIGISYFWSNRDKAWLYVAAIPLILITLYVISSSLAEVDLLRRFTLFFEDDVDLNAATSGRLVDINGALDSINENGFYWLFGQGIGATFVADHIGYNSLFVTHYTHFTPLSYVFLGGVLLLVPIYMRLVSLFIYAINHTQNFYSLLFMYIFVTSVTGASLFTDPFMWVIAGILLANSRLKANNF